MQKNDLEFFKNLFTPYTKRVYLVGGCVRDKFLGIKSKDFDIEVYDIDINIFDDLMKKIGAKGVGKSFFVYKYKNYDISLPRIENKISKGHRGFEVKLCNDEKIASRRRDFTCNAIMQNIFTKEYLDFYGGIEDIKNKTLRHIDDNSFIEDSLRVLRAMQFASRFKFKISPQTIKLCKSISLNDLSKDRIYKEFEKMFNSKYLYYGFYYFITLNIAKKLFDIEFSKQNFFYLSKKFKQNPHFGYFLYHLKYTKKLPNSIFIDTLNPPNKIKKILKLKRKPKIITNRFLIALSTKYPLKEWSVLNNNCCKEFLIKNNIYEKKYSPKNIDKKNPRQSILDEIKNTKKFYLIF